MRLVLQNKCFIILVVIFCTMCTSNKEGKNEIDVNSQNENKSSVKIDANSVAYRAVNNRELKKFYYNRYIKTPWSSSGHTKSIYCDTILNDKVRSIPTLIRYLKNENDSIRITAYILLTEVTGKYSGNVHLFKENNSDAKTDSVINLYIDWWNDNK